MASRLLSFAIPLALYCGIEYGLTAPQALPSGAWRLFAIFASTIAALITKPMQTGGIAILSLTAVIVTNTIPIQNALNGFASPAIWLILLVCFIARSVIKVRLSDRIAYNLVKIFGKSKLGLSYSLVLTDLFSAPFILSTTARAGGIMMPIYSSIANVLENKKHAQELKNFLSQVYLQASCVTAAMFLTGTSANPLIQKIALAQGVTIIWSSWAIAAIVPGICSLLVIPYIVKSYFADINSMQGINFQSLAAEKLKELGPINKKEWIVIFVLTATLFSWILGPKYNINPTSTAFVALSLLLLTNILNFEEILSEKEAWNTFIWFSVIVMLASSLESFGIIRHFSNILGGLIATQSWHLGLGLITVVYFYSHYLFAGGVTHVSSMYGVFLSLTISIGAPPLLSALILGFASSLFMSLTHYGGASTALIFSGSTIPVGKWWNIGFVVSLTNLVIWSALGMSWWKILRLW